jgi:hypothetical protein
VTDKEKIESINRQLSIAVAALENVRPDVDFYSGSRRFIDEALEEIRYISFRKRLNNVPQKEEKK